MGWLGSPADQLGDRIWAKPVMRALLTFGAFSAVGPMIGGVLGFALCSILSGHLERLLLALIFLPFSLGAAVFTGYVVGLIPAALAGLFFATVDFGRQRTGPVLALVVGALLGLPLTDLDSLNSSGGWSQLAGEFGFWGSVSATLACWWICSLRRPLGGAAGNEPHRRPGDA